MKDLQLLVRPNIWSLEPYSSARDEYKGHVAHVFLDANESPYNEPYNRYPDPLQTELKKLVSQEKSVPEERIFVGNGSDEAIDLVYRVFCVPGLDNVVAIEPTYGMYAVCAAINDVDYRRVLLDEEFRFSADRLLEAANSRTKAIFLCSPNNPTGNDLDRDEMLSLVRRFDGIVVVDEAYADFSDQRPMRAELESCPNLVILNTLSKAWGSAGIRLGLAYASKEIVGLFNKVKYPYNVSTLAQEKAIEILRRSYDVHAWVGRTKKERARVIEAFRQLPICKTVYPTSANFFLARMTDAETIYRYLIDKGIVVRNRSHVTLCGNCLRVTIGNTQENVELLSALRKYVPE